MGPKQSLPLHIALIRRSDVDLGECACSAEVRLEGIYGAYVGSISLRQTECDRLDLAFCNLVCANSGTPVGQFAFRKA